VTRVASPFWESKGYANALLEFPNPKSGNDLRRVRMIPSCTAMLPK
jgi:hypothetical protein